MKPPEAKSFIAFVCRREINLIAFFLAFCKYVSMKALSIQNVYANALNSSVPIGATHVYENAVLA